MLIGIGIDCVEISRFEGLESSFFNRNFKSGEIKYCNSKPRPLQHYAVRFAAKEAVIKALSNIDIFIDLNSIEIERDSYGRPSVKIYGDFNKDLNFNLSLSHSNDFAIANVIVSKNE